MVNNALGYVFEGRYDALKKLGLFENYKTLSYMGELIVTLTVGVDNNAEFLTPSYIDTEGMKSLRDYLGDDDKVEGLARFIRSNKGTVSDFRNIGLIVDCKFYIDEQTCEINKDKSVVRFFLPKSVRDKSGIYNQYGTEEPGIVCDEVKTSKGLNVEVIAENLYQGYLNKIYSNISGKELMSRDTYLLSRIK